MIAHLLKEQCVVLADFTTWKKANDQPALLALDHKRLAGCVAVIETLEPARAHDPGSGPSPWQAQQGMQVSSLSPTGDLTEYATHFPSPNDITAGPHQTVWFTEQGHIGRIKICGDDCESEGNDD